MCPVKSWDRDKVIEVILERHANGLPLNSNFQQLHNASLYCAATNYCGSWRKAIEDAGLKYDDVKIKKRATPKWGKEKVVKTILNRKIEDLPLNSNFVQLNEQLLYAAACKYFKGWRQAIEASGLDYNQIRKVFLRTWSKKAIVAEIKRRKRKGLSVNGETVSSEDRGLYNAARRHFGIGGWKKALLFAGINPKDIDPNRKWTKRRILSRIRKLHRAGLPVYGYALIKSGQQNLVAGAEKYFGSWRKAIEAAGLQWKKVRGVKKFYWWTPDRVKSQIRYWANRGESLSLNSFRKDHGDLVGAAILHFESWSQAVYASGIDYLAHTKVWSTKAWLRNLSDTDVQNLEQHVRKASHLRRKNART